MSEGSAINSAAGNAQANAAVRDLPAAPPRAPAQIGGRTMQAGTRGAPAMGLKIASTPDRRNAAPAAPGARGRVLPQPLGGGQNNPLNFLQSATHRAAQNRAPAPQQMGTQPQEMQDFLQSDTHRNAHTAPATNTERAVDSDLTTDLLVFDVDADVTDAFDEPTAARPRPARMGARQPMPSVLMSTRFNASVRTDTTSIDTRTDSRKWEFAPIPNNELEDLTAAETMDKHRAELADLHPNLGVPMEQDAAHEINENTEAQQSIDLENKRSAEEYLDKALKPKSTMRQLWEMLPGVHKT